MIYIHNKKIIILLKREIKIVKNHDLKLDTTKMFI